MMKTTKVIVGALFGVLCMASAIEARADQKQECSAAYDATQSLRDYGKLLDARKQAMACSDKECAAFIREECSQWLISIDALVPTVVFAVKDASGADRSAVRIILDGRVLLELLDGSAVPVDPGKHHVRFEIAAMGALEKDFVLQKGKKGRKIEVLFDDRATRPTTPSMTSARASASLPPAVQGVVPAAVAPDAAEIPKPLMPIGTPDSSSDATIPTWAWFSGGAGLGLGALGTVVLLASRRSGSSTRDLGSGTGIVLTTVGSLALVGGVLGGVLAKPSTASAPEAVSLTPVVTPTGGGFFAHGVF